jgi:hypothetical protein
MRARARLEETLQRWREEGLIHSGWSVDWDRRNATWKVAFRMRGCAAGHSFTQAQFELYLLGFTERSTAIRHRRPQRERPTPGKQAPRV